MAAPYLVQNQRTKMRISLVSPDFDLSLATGVNFIVTSALRSETWAATIAAGATATTLDADYYPLGVAVGGVLNADEVLTIRPEPVGPYGVGGASCSLLHYPPVVVTVRAERGPL